MCERLSSFHFVCSAPSVSSCAPVLQEKPGGRNESTHKTEAPPTNDSRLPKTGWSRHPSSRSSQPSYRGTQAHEFLAYCQNPRQTQDHCDSGSYNSRSRSLPPYLWVGVNWHTPNLPIQSPLRCQRKCSVHLHLPISDALPLARSLRSLRALL